MSTQDQSLKVPAQRRIRRWGIIAFVNIIVVIVLMEVGLRTVAPCLAPPPVYEPHPIYGHFHILGSRGTNCSLEFTVAVNINERGLRADDSLGYAKPPGIQRVLVIGDSFTEGFGVEAEDAYAAQLEALLNADGTSVQVINGGVAGYGTAHALRFLMHEGLQYQPDLVIYGFYPNDVSDSAGSNLFSLTADGALNPLPISISDDYQISSFLNNNFYTYRALNRALKFLGRQSGLIERPRELSWPIYRAALEEDEIQAWALTAALLQEMQRVVSAAGARLLVVGLPEIFQVLDTRWEEVTAGSAEPLRRDAPGIALAERIPPGVDYLDLLPVFQSYTDRSALYYPLDTHFTPDGHKLVAERIADRIRSDGLLD